MSVVIALGMAAIAGQFVDLSTFITNMVTMIGLAMGIDYSLFIISRYREERTNGREKVDAIGRTGATAGRAVLFSGTCVILALAGLLLVPTRSSTAWPPVPPWSPCRAGCPDPAARPAVLGHRSTAPLPAVGAGWPAASGRRRSAGPFRRRAGRGCAGTGRGHGIWTSSPTRSCAARW